MPDIQTFRGWRYHPEKVEINKVLAPPFGSIDPVSCRKNYKKHVLNFIRVVAPGEYSDDSAYDSCFTRAAAHLSAWKNDGALYNDNPAFYICEQDFVDSGKAVKQRGFFARMLLERPHDGIVCAREPESVRLKFLTNLFTSCRGQVLPMVSGVDAEGNILADTLNSTAGWQPTYEIEFSEGVKTRLWVVDDEGVVAALRNKLSSARIDLSVSAEEYFAALEVCDTARNLMHQMGESPPPHGEIPVDWCLAYFYPKGIPSPSALPSGLVSYFF